MSRSLLLSVACLGLLAAGVARGQDDLFSDVEIGSVFGSDGSPSSGGAAAVAPSKTTAIAGPASLGEALRNAGFEPKEVSSQFLSVQATAGESTRTAFLSVSDDRERVRVILPLTEAKKGTTVSASRLSSLMDANRADHASHFAFSASLGRIELHLSLENRDLTGERLRAAIEAMISRADATAGLWNEESVTAAKPDLPSASAGSAGSATAPALSVDALAGSWSATRSATQAFALRLNADGSFALVTVNGKQNAQSTGTFALSGDRLSLNDKSGGSLSGTVTLRSADEFEFVPAAGSAGTLVFKRAK